MANKNLFSSMSNVLARATGWNAAGGPAYERNPQEALAQIAATGTFHGTFYSQADAQLTQVVTLANQVDNLFLAKLALYARERGAMKDMPAALLLVLSRRDPELMHRIFSRVVDNGRILRTLFQMLRSGRFGRKGLSASLQRAFQRWLNDASTSKLLSASIGNDPSLRDILRLARPTPKDNARRALFGWLTNKPVEKWAPATAADLPDEVQGLMAYRQAGTEEEQAHLAAGLKVRWDLLADAAKGPRVWKAIANQMGPQALRMNLNTLLRHGVFSEDGAGREIVRKISAWLTDPREIKQSKQFPYQFFSAYLNAADDVPQKIKKALQQAAEIACGNIPELPGPVVIGLDVSGSMSSPITGQRGGGTSKMRCIDVAALFAAAILRRNPESIVIPFDTAAYEPKFDPHDAILSLAARLAKYGGGGTDCSLPLKWANARKARPMAGVILVSDNESWIYQGNIGGYGRHGSTGVMSEWDKFVQTQRKLGQRPKLICLDLQPSTTTQAQERDDVLNIGGFSDAVFDVVSGFLSGTSRFVKEIEAVEI